MTTGPRLTRLVARAARTRTQAQIRYVAPVPPAQASGVVTRVYDGLEREFGLLAPPVTLHASAPEPLSAVWLMLRESLVAAGRVPRPVKETVAVAVSLANSCPYCAQVHQVALNGLGGFRDAKALVAGDTPAVVDARLRQAADWARAGVEGRAPGPAPVSLSAAESPAGELPELIGTAVTFDYLNRMVNLFLPDSPVPDRVPAAVAAGLKRLAGALLRPALRRAPQAGTALDLLPPAPLPADLAWARGNPAVARAFARAAAGLERAGARSVPATVQRLVTDRLTRGVKVPAGPSRAWVRPAVADLDPEQRPVAQLTLVLAGASYQAGPGLVAEFRDYRGDDRTLVEVAAWASFAAARRLGAWLWSSGPGRSNSDGSAVEVDR